MYLVGLLRCPHHNTDLDMAWAVMHAPVVDLHNPRLFERKVRRARTSLRVTDPG